MANTNGRAATLYVGMTSNLERRAAEHMHPDAECDSHRFTRRYRLTRLVFCEEFQDVRDAIAREKQIKGWRRDRTISLIESENPDWRDLFEES